MTNSHSTIRSILFTLSLLFGAQVYAEAPKNDVQAVEEINKFADESSKMREEHIKEMREEHLKHINEMYDRKLSHNSEMTLLWKQMKPGDKKANKELKNQIYDKKKSFKKDDEKFRANFKDNILKKKRKEFHEIMRDRMKEMKGKFKD